LEAILREFSYQNWITIIIVGCLILLAIVKNLYYNDFIDFIKLNGADKYINTRSKGTIFFRPIQLVLFSVQCAGITLLFYTSYCILNNLSFKENYLLFSIILLAYLLFEIIKAITESFIGYTLQVYIKMRPFIYKRLNVKNLLGLLALSFSIIMIYQTDISKLFVTIAITTLVFFYIISQVWLLKKYRKEFIKFPFYFILYFCTLEISPYYILYKFIAHN